MSQESTGADNSMSQEYPVDVAYTLEDGFRGRSAQVDSDGKETILCLAYPNEVCTHTHTRTHTHTHTHTHAHTHTLFINK